MSPARVRRRRIALGLFALALVLLLVLWDWDWLRPLVERQASSTLGRPVTLQHFDVDLGRYPVIEADGIAIGNPPGFAPGTQLGSVEALRVKLEFWPLLRRELRLLQIDLLRPLGDLGPGPDGTRNWKFEFKDDTPSDENAPPPQIGALNIRDGHLHIVEPDLKADFTLDIRTEPAADGEPQLRIDAKGTYAGQPIVGRFIGGSVLTMRDPTKPYPVDLEALNGQTRVDLKGFIERPLQLGGARLDLAFSGDDMAELYPLTGVPLPPTAAYRVKGRLDFNRRRIRFHDFSGVAGQSDIGGDLEIDLSRAKRLITADVASNKVLLADLAGIIGAAPGKPGAASDTPDQQQQRAEDAAKPRVLPDRPINLPKLRAADVDIRYRGKRIESDRLPLDDLSTHLIVRDGYLSFKPLRFGIGQGGVIASNVELDGTKQIVHTVVDIDFRRIDLKRIMRESKLFDGAGLIGGSARIDGHGNSLAQALAGADGELKLFMTDGELSALMVNLAGLEFGKALLSLLGMPSKTEIRCMVSDLELKKGMLRTRTLVLDTGEANIIGEGSINLADEAINFQIRTDPKRFGLGSLKGPINIGGHLKQPTVGLEVDDLAARGGVAAVLGTLLGPLAALIPTIELGLGEDHDCKALVESVGAAAQALKRGGLAPPKAGRGDQSR